VSIRAPVRSAAKVWCIYALGRYECIYHHMPPFGLGRALPLVPAKGRLSRAKDRLRAEPEAARAA
jgi:hypothetical protein